MIKLNDITGFHTFTRAIICCGLVTMTVTSCLEEPEVKLLQVDKEYIDSIFSHSIDSLKDEMDSLCLVQRNELFEFLVDSIKQKRLEEIQAIFKKK